MAALLVAGGWALTGNGSQAAYRTAKITRGSITEMVTATGTLNPVQLVNVGTQVSGKINNVYVQVNDQVKAGQLLAEIDPSLLITQVNQDRSNLETARVNDEQAARDLERNRMLLAKDYVAKVDLEHAQQAYLLARNAYDSSKIQVERDEVNLNYAKILSPIDGVIISQDAALGETLTASFQTPNMFKIAGDLTKMKIDVNLSESDISKVKVDMPVTFTADAFSGRQFMGKVQRINLNPNTQQGVVTYNVIVAVDNQDKVLLPGMTAYVSITLSEKKDVLRVPAAALRFVPPPEQVSGLRRLFSVAQRPNSPGISAISGGDHSQTLYLLRDGALVPVQVRVGSADDTYVEVFGDGIAEGDSVVTGLMPSGRH